MKEKEETPIEEIMELCKQKISIGQKTIDTQALYDWLETKLLKKETELLERTCKSSKTILDDEYKDKLPSDLVKYGRTDFKYKVHNVSYIKYIGDFRTKVTGPNGHDTVIIETYNIIDPQEGDFIIKFSGVKQIHSIENLSLIADLFCDYTKIDKDCIVIFKKENESYYLGTTNEFQNSKQLWDSFKEKGVELYY